MAVDKLVDSTQLDSDLTSVANAIRTKGGTSAQLAFPSGFVSAIGDISGGGGDYVAADWGDPTKPTGAVTVTKAYSYNDRDVCSDLFERRTGVTSVTLSNAVCLPNKFFFYSGVAQIIAPLLEESMGECTSWCTNLTGLVLPSFKNMRGNGSFMNCSNIEYVDLGGASGGEIRANAFNGDAKLAVLVLRATSAWTLANVSAFNSTPFASGKAGGTLYVPNDLIATYQGASNWSTILGYANNSIQKIEGSYYATHYADGTTIPT